MVVPHRAALQQAFAEMSVIDAPTGMPTRSVVDTVERFQGGERTVALVSATESDRGQILAFAGFLLDLRRLSVAVSRAKRKMNLVASRSVFALDQPRRGDVHQRPAMEEPAGADLHEPAVGRSDRWHPGRCLGKALTVR